jgi:hypothetical protein
MTDTRKYPARDQRALVVRLPDHRTVWCHVHHRRSLGQLPRRAGRRVAQGHRLLLLTIDSAGAVTKAARMAGVEDTYGRLRAPQMGPEGVLYVTTSEREGQDKILRIVPTGT